MPTGVLKAIVEPAPLWGEDARRAMKEIVEAAMAKPKFPYTTKDLLSDGDELYAFYLRWKDFFEIEREYSECSLQAFKEKIRYLYENPGFGGINSCMDIAFSEFGSGVGPSDDEDDDEDWVMPGSAALEQEGSDKEKRRAIDEDKKAEKKPKLDHHGEGVFLGSSVDCCAV